MRRTLLIATFIGIANALSSQTVTLDKVNCIPGTLGGVVDVSSSGAASYSLPVQVSPGSHGMQPNLSVVYSSQGGNGLLGWGWNLAGLSSISRVSKIKYYDNTFDAVSLTNLDAFTLDGVRLINTSSDPLNPSSTYYPSNNPYTKVVLSSNTFTVTTQDGVVMEYGKEGNSLVYSTNSSTPISYSISRITDPEGNYIQFIYEGSNGEYRISEVKYTGNSKWGKAPYNSILFHYSSRPDVNSLYVSGGKINQSVLLSSIKVFCEGAISKEYQFAYTTDQYSKLSSISLTADGLKYNPTIIRWNASADFSTIASDPQFGSTHNFKIFTGDINGDGLTDIIKWDYRKTLYASIKQSDGNYYSSTIDLVKEFIDYDTIAPIDKDIQILDRNNDGKDEIIVNSAVINKTTYVSSKVSRIYTFEGGSFYFQTESIDVGTVYKYYYADINNDGTIERLTVKNNYLIDCYGVTIPSPDILSENVQFMDFDGDGRTDILTIAQSGYAKIWECEGTSLVNRYNGYFGTPNNLFLGDFNGDGKTDYLSFKVNKWYLYYSTGNGFELGTAPNLAISTKYSGAIKKPEYLINTICIDDINNDGKSDICQVSSGNIGLSSVFISKGNSFNSYLINNIKEVPKLAIIENETIQSIDLDNDGQKELIYGYNASISETPQVIPYKKITFQPTLKRNLYVNSIVDGLNNQSIFTYKTFTDNRQFTPSFPKPAFPLVLVRGPWQVVDQLTRESIGSSLSISTFTYTNGYSHIGGLGFLGFKNISASNSSSGAASESTFDYTIPGFDGIYNTWLKSQTVTKGVTSSITNTMELRKVDEAKKSFLPLVTKSVSVDGATGITTTNSISDFDLVLGRVTKRTTKINDVTIVYETPYVPVSENTSRPTSISETKGTYTSSVSLTYENASSLRVTGKATNHGVNTSYPVFDSYGNPKSISVNSRGETRTNLIEYDSYGRFATQSTDVLGNISTASYRSCDGAKLTEVNSLGKSTTYSYSFSNGALLSTISTPDGNTIISSLGWDDTGTGAYLIQKKLNGFTLAKTYFNANGQKVKEELAGYRSSTITNNYSYNSDGTLSSVVNPAFSQPTSYSYTAYGRLQSVTGVNKDLGYAYNGTSVTISDGIIGTTQTQNFDVLGNIQSTTGTTGDITYTYSPAGRVTGIQAGGGFTQMEYDDLGNQTKLIDPNAGTTTYEYNGFGQLTSQTDAMGQRIECSYDKGLLLSKSGKNLAESYTYDESAGRIGRLLSVKRNDVTETYAYDELGRVTQVETKNPENTFTTTYEYDSHGLMYKATQPTGLQLQYVYDDALNLTKILSLNAGTTNPLWEGFKSPDQLWSSYTLGNNLTTKWNYDANYMIQGIKTGTTSNPSSIQDLIFTFDRNGQLKKRAEGSLVEDFHYDGLNRLIDSKVGLQAMVTYSYEGNGNISSTSLAGSYTYDASHPHAVGSVSWQSGDAQSPSLITTRSSFTVDNRIDTIRNGSYMNVFAYSPSGDRFKVERYKNNARTSTKVHVGSSEFIYNGSGALVCKRTMVYAPTGICAVYQDSASVKAFHYIHTDYLGSWLKITDQNGSVENRYSYDAWGRLRNPNTWALLPVSTADALTNLSAMQPRFDRGYTGHEYMAGFGLINMNGRLYDPYLQRFLNPDIFIQDPTNTQNFNRYSYCVNNPLMYTDPSGWQMLAIDQGWELDSYFSRLGGDVTMGGNYTSGGGGFGGFSGQGSSSYKWDGLNYRNGVGEIVNYSEVNWYYIRPNSTWSGTLSQYQNRSNNRVTGGPSGYGKPLDIGFIGDVLEFLGLGTKNPNGNFQFYIFSGGSNSWLGLPWSFNKDGGYTYIPSIIDLPDLRRVKVTFNYPSPTAKNNGNQLVRTRTLEVLKYALSKTPGIYSIDISATTNGSHNDPRHRLGLAIDIDNFNGTNVFDNQKSQLIIDFQKALETNKFLHQNFGPSYNFYEGHETHVHFSIKYY